VKQMTRLKLDVRQIAVLHRPRVTRFRSKK
jgi:hypothetical protein